MTHKKFLVLLPFLFAVIQVNAQQLTREQYIEKYKTIAVKQMQKHKIPASITLAQGCLESGDGNSALARKANNHFGIKCHDGWKGKKYRQDDDERNECFRKYDNATDSYTDHSYFLTSRPRYNSLFDLKITDYKGWAHGLKAAGYATNPKYAQLLIDIIEEYKLYKYDNGVAAKEEKEAQKIAKKEKSLRKKAEKAEKKAEKASKKAAKAREKYNRFVEKNSIRQDETAKAVPSENIVAQDKKSDNTPVYSKKSHKVKEGDTLYSISRKYGITVDDIYRMNPGIKASELKIGSELKVE